MNERPINVTDNMKLTELYPDFVFRAKEILLF